MMLIQRGIGADRSLDILRADVALGGGFDIGDFKAHALQRSHAVHDGVVLERAGDQVLLALTSLGEGRTLDGPVVGLGTAAGEEDLSRSRIDGLGDLCTAGVHELFCFVADAVMAAGIAACSAQSLGHHSQYFGRTGSGGSVVQIDNLFRNFHGDPVLSSDEIGHSRTRTNTFDFLFIP